MTRFDFSPLFRSTIGFERLPQLLDTAMTLGDTGNSYPPYNIEKTGEDHYRITMAVAGFTGDELKVEARENRLIVAGDRKPAESDQEYLYRGIAHRSFVRQFQLADYVRVVTARLENGLLHLELVREIPEAMKPRTIAIESGAPNRPPQIDDGRRAA